MLKTIKKCLNIVAAFASLFSGLFWAGSAKAQMDILNLTGKNTVEIAEKLNHFSQHENYWAACGASLAGIALFLALFVEVFED